MKRRSPLHAALATAFSDAPSSGDASGLASARLRPYAIAFVAGFPAAIGTVALAAALSRSGTSDGAFPLGATTLAAGFILLVLGLRSELTVTSEALSVRFYGVRRTTVRFGELRSATFGMTFPSLSFAITLTDHNGTKALFHANWWQHEPAALAAICAALAAREVPVDRAMARIISRTLGVPRPHAAIVHRAWLRRDRTW